MAGSFQSSTAHSKRPQLTFHRQPGQVLEERRADTLAPELGEDEEVLKVEPPPGQERAVIMEEEREPRRRAVEEREHHLGIGAGAEEGGAESVFRGHALGGQALVLREPLDERADEGNVGRDRGAEGEGHGVNGKRSAVNGNRRPAPSRNHSPAGRIYIHIAS